MEESSNSNPDFVSTFARGLQVITVYGPGSSSLSFADVSRLTGFNRATARRLLLTLEQLGYARKNGGKFELTPKVLELGYAYLASMGLPELAEPFLDEISSKLGESCSISALSGSEIVYIARRPTSRIMSVSLSIGVKLPALWTSMGRVLLSDLSLEELIKLIDSAQIKAFTNKTITNKDQLITSITEVAKNGYCVIDQELELGLRAIAVPIYNRKRQIVAALNVSTHTSRMTLDDMHKKILPVLEQISLQIQKVLH